MIKENKEFILGVVAYGNKPDASNSIMLGIVNEYAELTGETIDLTKCLTCGENSIFDKIYKYAVDNEMWEVKAKKSK
jgi:hypothetical protein